jgi:hypothetical protein
MNGLSGRPASDAAPGGVRQSHRKYTDAFEMICCDCGDHPDQDYREVSPKLQLVRGPYPIADGVAAYEQHRRLHQQLGVPTSRGPRPILADWR